MQEHEFDVSDAAPPLVPMPPPTGAPESRYNARLSRARSSNRATVMQRSSSAASLAEDSARDESDRAEEGGAGLVGNPGASIAPKVAGFRKSAAPAWSRQVAAAMEAEIDRPDCRDMVRDITHAVLPTRASMRNGLGAVSLGRPASIGEDEDRDPATDEAASSIISSSPGRHRSPSPHSSPAVPRAAAVGERSEQPKHPARGGRALEHEWSGDSYADADDEDREATAMALKAAITSNRSDMVETLLVGASGDRIDPNCLVKGGRRPLSLAAANGLYDVSATLISNGADPAVTDDHGDTPLHVAAKRGHVALARMLLEAGAVPSALDSNGATPLQLAKTPQMQELLRAADAGDELPPRLEGEEEEDDDDEAGTSAALNGGHVEGAGVLSPSNKGRSSEGPAARGNNGKASKLAEEASVSTDKPAPYGPPPLPTSTAGDLPVLKERLSASELVRELQLLLNSSETDLKQLLVRPMGLEHEVQCDVVRVGSSNTYRCYLRLLGRNDRRLCIFEASRTRKGKLKNSQYRIMLPAADPRMVPSEYGPVSEMSDEALDAALYCGKVRSYNLSGANFIAYDDGMKPENMSKGSGGRARKQMVAMCFNKSTSRRVPMTMRMLLPTPSPTPSAEPPSGPAADLLETLQTISFETAQEAPPGGTQLLKLVPPRWNADEQMFQLFCEGRACCMSNKNVQLADTSRPDEAALQIGKLRSNMFNVDMAGCVSPFQAFAAALAVFDQSSVRRRF